MEYSNDVGSIAMRMFVYGLITGIIWDGALGQPRLVSLDTDGGYRGLLIAIDPDVTYHPHIIGNIYNYLGQTSVALNQAFKVKNIDLYIKEATILVPQTWPRLPQCNVVTSELQSEATFLVMPDTSQWGSTPHTLKLSSQCGKGALATIIPASFAEDQNVAKKYGDNVGKTLLHEWAHLRYGVFDELLEGNNVSSCLFFDEETVLPVKCSSHVQGHVTISEDSGSCEFTAALHQPPGLKASLMYLPYLNTVNTFCDDQGLGVVHNDQIPNEQNNRCDGRSVWSVLEQHSDVRNRPTQTESRTRKDIGQIPQRCVQSRDRDRMVLTMDVSGSMTEADRLLHMQQDVNLFLKMIPCRDTSLGLVEFSATGTERVLHDLVPLLNSTDSLIRSIPHRVMNRTCIGCGIMKALSILQKDYQDTHGAVVVVFTDGLENDSPRIEEIEHEVLRSGVVIYSILLLSSAHNHPLLTLSESTGGQSCIYTDTLRSTYYDCLKKVLYHRSAIKAPVQILNSGVSIPALAQHIGTVILDIPVRRHVILSVTWDDAYSDACGMLTIELISSENERIRMTDIDRYEVDAKLRSISIDVSNFKGGVWTYLMMNSHISNTCSVRILVEGRQLMTNCSERQTGLQPVIVLPYLENNVIRLYTVNSDLKNTAVLYVRLVQGSNPVIRANVTAYIENSHGTKWTLQLWDNGAGADLKQDDGIYSRYFFQYISSSFDDTYSIKYEVQWTAATRLQMSSSSFGLGAPILPQYRVHGGQISHSAIKPFQRSASGGHITVYHNTQGASLAFAPGKVTDIKVKVVERSQRLLTSWTAMGDQLDSGKASYCDIHICQNASDLRNTFHQTQLVGRVYSLHESGEKETHELPLEHINVTFGTVYFLGIKCGNGKNRLGPISNIALFILHNSSDTNTDDQGQITDSNTLPTWSLCAIIASSSLVLIFCIIALWVKCKRLLVTRSKVECTNETENVTPSDEIEEAGISHVETGDGCRAPDIISEIQATKNGLKRQNRYYKKEDGSFTVSKRTHGLSVVSGVNTSGSSPKICASPGMNSCLNSNKYKKNKPRSVLPQMNKGPWHAPDEPLQNHAYTNPLFGESSAVPEVGLRNSIISEKD